MITNVDERLLSRWTESRARQERTRTRLAQSSLPAERFEGWALDLITEALSPAGRDDAGKPPLTSATSGLGVERSGARAGAGEAEAPLRVVSGCPRPETMRA